MRTLTETLLGTSPAGRAGASTDLMAGLTVALVGLPQCLAYAMMSGLSPAYGLTTAIVAGFIAALAGRSAQVITGPTNTTGILILGALLPFLGANGLLRTDALRVLATLTLLAGLIRVAAALMGGAHLIRFMPDSVLIGFTTGAGVLIATMQLDEALGMAPSRGISLLSQFFHLLPFIHEVKWPAILVTVLTVVVVGLGGRWSRRAPLALIAVVVTSAIAWLFSLGIRTGLPLVHDRGGFLSGWPPIAIPDLSLGLLQQLVVPAAAIALLGTLELTVTARAGGERPDLRREIFSQGVANVAGSFAACIPASASLGRSALLRFSGARTRLAAVSTALFTVPILFFAGDLAGWIPQASLAGVLFVTAWRMVDWTGMRRLWKASWETRVLLLETLAATLFLPIELAILIGSGTGLVIYLANTSAPRLRLLRDDHGRLVPVAPDEQPEVVVIEVSGNLHYAAVPPFLSEAEVLIPPSARAVVIDLSHAHEIRFAALRAFERLAEELEHDGAVLWLAGVEKDEAQLLERAGSPLRWVADENKPGLSVRKCLEGLEGGELPVSRPEIKS